MDTKKLVLYFAIALVGVLLYNAWMHDYPTVSPQKVQSQQTPSKSKTDSTAPYVPSATKPSSAAKPTQKPGISQPQAANGKTISVKTDVLDVSINELGGGIVSASLPKYPVSLKEPKIPVQILNNTPGRVYVAQSGLTNTNNSGKTVPIHYTSAKSSYELKPGQDQLTVTLMGKTENGLSVKKEFIFQRNQYAIDIKYQIANNSDKVWQGNIYNQIVRRNVPMKTAEHTRSYNGAAISSPKEPYEKLNYKTLDEKNVDQDIKGGWIAMQQQYFLSAWVPNKISTNHYYSHVSPTSDPKESVYTIGYLSPGFQLAPSSTVTSQSKFYVGPEIASQLKSLAKGLELTIDYGWLWPISKIIFWVMAKIHSVVGNWGWSIVLVTLLIKILFYPLSSKSYKSMAKMRDLQPRIQLIKERYGDDKQAMSKATMELYKKEKANPMGGCLPMLIQIPVFIALYYVLIESVELRQAPWILWIHDLSVKDPYYVLPILMGLSMLLQQKISPPPPDPTQAKLMLLMPVIFTVFFLNFPSGLVLYWLTNNLLSVLQQWYIMRAYKGKKVVSKAKKLKA